MKKERKEKRQEASKLQNTHKDQMVCNDRFLCLGTLLGLLIFCYKAIFRPKEAKQFSRPGTKGGECEINF